MPDLCSQCGANLAMIGKSHRCVPKSRGGVESRHTIGLELDRRKTTRDADGQKPSARVASSPRETTTKPIKRKVGRPRLEDVGKTLKATKPWAEAGMSRSTWYSRHAEKRNK